MDVLREANERAAGGRRCHSSGGRPAFDAGATQSGRSGGGGASPRGARLYRRARPAGAARGDRPPLSARLRVAIDPARIVVTTGSSAGFILAFLAAFDAGERVALAAPSYPAYRNILAALDLVPVELAGRAGGALSADARSVARPARADRRPDHRQPGQSDRQHDRSGELGGDRPALRHRGHPARSRTRFITASPMSKPAVTRAALRRRRDHRQQLLEILSR